MDANNSDKSQKNALKQKINTIRQFFFHILFHFNDEYLMKGFYSNDNDCWTCCYLFDSYLKIRMITLTGSFAMVTMKRANGGL